MSRPVVAIVGRPNVGKSTLFNALAGERISIVKDTPGVTRDRIYADVSWLDYNFTMIDTGGIEPESGDVILSQMREQAQIAIDTADVIIFITDVKQGLVDSDSKVADMLRRSHKPVVLVVNKVDSFEKYMTDVYEFYNLGIGDPHPISAASMLGLGDMLDEVVKHFPDSSKQNDEDDRPRVAIVGKPNVGKSSLINKLAREDRVIVSDIAGTTRDAIDTAIKYDGKEYIFIDTAGLRRKNKIKEDIERYSIIRAVSTTSGDFSVMLNSVYAAQHPHSFIYTGWEVNTHGNDLAHTVLRGATNKHGANIPNYHYEDLIRLWDMYEKMDLKNPACVIDANHSNSNKQFKEQIRITKEVMHSRKLSSDLHQLVKGVMIESYIEEGNQKVGAGCYGKSITDPCLGWDDTERLIYDIAEYE